MSRPELESRQPSNRSLPSYKDSLSHPNGQSQSVHSSSGQTQPPARSSAFRTQFATLSMHMTDRIRLMNFPDPMIALIRSAINSCWPGGIQQESDYAGSREFKLRGNPWRGMGGDGIHARRLMRVLLQALADAGWMLTLSTDISKKALDLDTLLFRLQAPPPPRCAWICIAFSRHDRLRFIDAPPELVAAALAALRQAVQAPVPHQLPGVQEFKLVGQPWWATGAESMHARRILIVLLELLETFGFTVYASIDQKQGTNESGETDTWHCCRPIGWQPGMPVFHA